MNASRGNQYDVMLAAAVARLDGASPEAIAALAGIPYDAESGAFTFESFGRRVELTWPGFEAVGLDMWHHLALLQYLVSADGNGSSGRWVSLADLGEVSRGESFNRELDRLIADCLSRFTAGELEQRCLSLGGRLISGQPADLCAIFDFAPRCPFQLNLWVADDEFPASGRVLVDAAIGRTMGVEVAGTAAQYLVKLLAEADAQQLGGI